MAKRGPSDRAQMNLRLPEKLRKKVEIEARKNGVSLNGELVRRLEQSFHGDAAVKAGNEVATNLAPRFQELGEQLDRVLKLLGNRENR